MSLPWPVQYPDSREVAPWPADSPITVDEAVERFVAHSHDGSRCTDVELTPLVELDDPYPTHAVTFHGGRVADLGAFSECEVRLAILPWGSTVDPLCEDAALHVTVPRVRAHWDALVGAETAKVYGIDVRWDSVRLRVFDPDGADGDEALTVVMLQLEGA